MKLKTLFILACITLAYPAFSQEIKDRSKYSQTLSLDTSLTPDYFKVEISISEYYRTTGKGKRRTSEKIPLDSVKEALISELRKNGFNQNLVLSKISERDQNYSGDVLFQGTFEFNSGSKDSIETLYRKLYESLTPYSLRRIKVTPGLTQETLKKARESLEALALEKVRADAKKYAEQNKMSIVEVEHYQFGFNKMEKYDSETYTGQTKAYNIVYSKPLYTLTSYYTFRLK